MKCWMRTDSNWNRRRELRSCAWEKIPRRNGHDGPVVFRNLFHRPLRTLIGVVAIAVEVTLVIVVVGLTSGMLQETAKRIEGIGADIMVQAPSAQIFIVMSGSPMPIKIGEKIHDLKYVQYVSPAFLQFNTSGGVETIWELTRLPSATFPTVSCFMKGTTCRGRTICWWTTGRPERST